MLNFGGVKMDGSLHPYMAPVGVFLSTHLFKKYAQVKLDPFPQEPLDPPMEGLQPVGDRVLKIAIFEGEIGFLG